MFKIWLTFILLIVISGCVPQSGGGGGASAKKNSNVGTAPTNNNSTYTNTLDIFWFSQNTSTKMLTLNADTQSVFYLRGKTIETYLSQSAAFNSIHCLDVVFSGTSKILRTRVAPMTNTNFSSNSSERLFRVDIDNSTQSSFACNDLPVNANLVYTLKDVCPTCASTISATSIKLYKSAGTTISTQVPTSGQNSISLLSLTLKLDPKSNSTNPIGTCTDTQCKGNGYDCCLQGQCVNDGTIKLSSQTDSNFLNLVKPLVDGHFSTYTSWPQYYNVCPQIPNPLPTATPSATTDPAITAQINLTNLKNYYFCIKELEYRTTVTPFNINDFSSTTFPAPACTGTTTQIETCLTNYRTNFATNNYLCNATTAVNYMTVIKNVYSICGCSATNWTLSANDSNYPVNACPYYSLNAFTSTGQATTTESQIASIQCSVSIPNPVATPFQMTNVNLPSRSSPHRFFKSTDGTSVDDITTLVGSTVTSEGTAFSYLDPGTYIMPQNGTNNMNSILGQFDVTLTKALPAKVINVTYDTSYIISTTTGNYSPCPMCMKDSWYSAFTANPQSTMGTGLQSSGYTTDREIYGTNIHQGNYEDTIFGRACFIPPTMIPFSHKAYSTTVTQRQNRLTAQATYFINGYQRDWFGFNKGAVIGSFDGVTWFAIGKGRRVQASSNKLYLAINAPFADLASPNNLTVMIREDDNNDTAANFDYDFDIDPWDLRQNEAASCQRFHKCSTDTDCVTKLGWEYVCADVASLKTTWPKFNSSSAETANTSQTFTLSQVLQGQQMNGSTKRCVYRGAGAPCSTAFASVSTNENLRRLTSCAPNFYCADKSATDFNKEIARFATGLDQIPLAKNHYFGKDANVLGRPLSYHQGTSTLPTAHKDALSANASLMGYSASAGICRPGRNISSSSFDIPTQHAQKDASLRTDFINQIGGCDSTQTGIKRVYGCPIIDTKDSNSANEGNYAHFSLTAANMSLIHTNTNLLNLSQTQNTCGKESVSGSTSLFSMIESKTLNNVTVIQKTLAADACLRRAGAVCHSDLDCSPNKMHAETAGNFSYTSFGTDAEKKYWEEYLVCGQGSKEPSFSSSIYYEYDMGQNRCCRPVGKTISMYTSNDPLIDTPSAGVSTASLSLNSPSSSSRYSRYSVVSGFPSTSYPAPSASITDILGKPNQWKTFNQAAKNTCCGGGWIRKFADGSHSWPIGTRASFNLNDFQCLNYSNSLVGRQPSNVAASTWSAEIDRMCAYEDNKNGNCAQVPMATSAGYSITYPSTFTDPLYGNLWSTFVQTSAADAYLAQRWDPTPGFTQAVFPNFFPYQPIAVPGTYGTFSNSTNLNQPYFPKGTYSHLHHITIRLPSYINGIDNINGAGISLRNAAGTIGIPCLTYGSGATTADKWCWAGSGNHFCIAVYGTLPDGGQYLTIRLNPWCSSATVANCASVTNNNACGNYAPAGATRTLTENLGIGFDLNFATLGTYAPYSQVGAVPGNDLYYLNKLGKFELTGIPQTVYEPLYCTWDKSELVPNLYKVSTRTAFEAVGTVATSIVSTSDNVMNSTQKIVTAAQVNKDAVFSNNEFVCCNKLGAEVSTSANCCSNYSKNGKCALPPRTDLHVYFNRFVSGEGNSSSDLVFLEDTDYDSYSGEPKLQASTMNKINSLGEKYCSSGKVRQGAAFGNYDGEPVSSIATTKPKRYSIVDSYNDLDTDSESERGANAFNAGYRWNHHLYCDEE